MPSMPAALPAAFALSLALAACSASDAPAELGPSPEAPAGATPSEPTATPAAASATEPGDAAAIEPADAPTPADAPATATASPDDGPDTWTTTPLREQRTGATARVVAVRAGRHDTYDRVVFELAGDQAPGWSVAYADGPVRDCGSGAPVALGGGAALRVELSPAVAHDPSGAPVGPKEQLPGFPALAELERTCDFEALTTYVLGVTAPTAYRVFELDGPPRVVVDVRH